MRKIYDIIAAAGLLHLFATTSQAQAPVLLSRLPAANAVTASPAGPVQLTFSQQMSAQTASTTAVRVVSAWRGQLPGSYSGAGTTQLSFMPTRPLLGGEPIQVTLTNRVTSQAGVALSAPIAYQFQAAAGGTGRFADEDVPVGASPRSIAAGDINRDGNPDFVSTGAYPTSVSILLGDGHGGYLPPAAPIPAQVYAGGVGTPDRVKLADVNGDGLLDLVALQSSQFGAYGVSLGDGTGKFTVSFTDVGSVYDMAVGDINEDGKADVLLEGDGAIFVRLGDSQGHLTAGTNVPAAYAAGLKLVDVNGDNHLDILGASAGTLLVRLGNGQGGFTAAPGSAAVVAANALEMATGDVNEDGKLDVLLTNLSANTVSVRLGNGQGGFQVPATADVSVGPTPHFLVLSDFNRDGHLDFVCSCRDGFTTTTVSVRLGNGQGGFSSGAVPELPVGIQPDGLALTDCNRDGQPDLLIGNVGYPSGSTRGTYGTVSVRLSDGTGKFVVPSTARVALGSSVQSVKAADVNNDGKLDLLILGYSIPGGGLVSVRLGTGTGRFETPPTPTPAAVTGLGVNETLSTGDVNNDGKLDFVVDQTLTYGRRPVTYLGDGSGGFTALPLTTSGLIYDFPTGAQLVDLTGDGNLDLLLTCQVVNSSTSSVQIRLGDGTGKFADASTTLLMPASAVCVGDVNDDGKLDLLLGASNKVTVLLGNGSGGFASPSTPVPTQVTMTNGASIVEMATTDLNGDGKLDFVACGGISNNGLSFLASAWLGTGTGSFQPGGADVVIGATYPSGIALGDLNGDGKPDMAVSSNRSGQLSIGDKVTLRLGDGTGGFTLPAGRPQLTAGLWPGDINLADVDNDGDLDILMPNFWDNSVTVRLNGPSAGSVLPVRAETTASVPTPLRAYPNPAHGTTTVEGAGAEQLIVLDLMGQVVYQQRSGPVLITEGIRPGLYLLRCGTRTTRLVVE